MNAPQGAMVSADSSDDTVKKSYRTILEEEIEQGSRELDRSVSGLLLSGLSAGLDVGFSVLVLAVVATLAQGHVAPPVLAILKASGYTVGFILVIFGRSELFTEHTTLAVLPVLDRRASVRRLLRLWGAVYVANLVGAAIFALLLSWLGPALGVVSADVIRELSVELVAHPASVVLASAVLAGWMMGLVSWLVTAGRDTVGQIIFVWIVTGAIGLCGLHHCIVGTVEVLTGAFAGAPVDALDFARFLGLATFGNVVGGTVFVALLKFAHARAGGGGVAGGFRFRRRND